MYKVILAIHVMTTLALIAIILVQRSSSDGMGLSGSSSSNNFLSGRAAASFASRATAALACVFILTSLTLGIITAHNHVNNGSIADKIKAAAPAKPSAPVPSAAATTPLPTTSGASPVTTPATPSTAPAAPAAAVQPTTPAEKPATSTSIPKPE